MNRVSRLLAVLWLALCPAPTTLGTATAAQAPVTVTLTLPRRTAPSDSP